MVPKWCFANLSGCQKGGFKQKMAFFSFFYIGERHTENRKQKEKTKMPRKNVLGVGGTKVDLVKNVLEKSQNTICDRNVEKRAFSSTLSVLGKWSVFVLVQITKHYKNRVFNKHKGKKHLF